MQTDRNRLGRFFANALSLVILTAALRSAPLYGQDFRATLNGQITDRSGAMIVNATITAINNQTKEVYTAKPTKTGTYYLPYMVPGSYTLKVTAPGFEEVDQDNVVMSTSETRGLNFKLNVGGDNQVVTVEDAPPLLNAADGSGGTIFTQREIEDSPINGRSVYSLLGTTPGSQMTTTNVAATTGNNGYQVSDSYVIGGGVAAYQQFNLNGTNITEQSTGAHGSWELSPNIDALQEVNVMTSTYDARFSKAAGGTINMVVKSGTDKFHGSLYEYTESDVFNANLYQRNAASLGRAPSHQNEFGATFGGPIIHGKLLFFGSYEGFRQAFGIASLESVPTAAMRNPDGSGANFSGTGYTIYDPNTTVCSIPGGSVGDCTGGTYSRTAFANDTIPAARISPIGQAILNLYPLPNVNSTSIQNNYLANIPANYRYDQYMGRVDYNISDKTRFYTLFAFQGGNNTQSSNGFTGVANYGSSGINVHHQQITASQDMTHTFNATTLLDLKVSFARYFQFTPDSDLSAAQPPSTIGLSMPTIPTTSLKALPEFTNTELYPQVVGNKITSGVYNDTSFNGDLTKQWGKHAFHFGGEYHFLTHGTPGQAGNANGDFKFGTFATQNNPLLRNSVKGITDGFTIADMLLGYPASGGVDWNENDLTYFPTWALYVQDDWKVTSKLTLNLGLRYDVTVGARSKQHGLNRGFCLTCVNPTTNSAAFQGNLTTNAAALTAAGINAAGLSTVTGGILFAGENGQPSDGYNTQFDNVGPRVGFAYQVNNKTVVRGGYGIMYLNGLENGTFSGSSQTTSYVASLNGGITPSTYFQSGNPFPNGAAQPLGAAGGLLTNIGNGQSLDFPGRKIPYTHLTSLGFQRALPDQMVLDVKFSGNYAYHLRTSTVLNPVSQADDLKAQASSSYFDNNVPNPYYGVLPATSTVGSSPTITALSLMHAYSAFGEVQWDAAPLGRNTYSALEVKIDKRVGGPDKLSFQLAYTLSKSMGATGYTNSWPYQDPDLRYEIDSTDRTHVFTLASQWNLPFGKGQILFSNPSRIVGEFINGWELSSILSMQSGQPVGINTNYYYGCSTFKVSGGSTLNNWLYKPTGATNGTTCDTAVPEYHLKNLADRITSVRTPTEPNFDASLQKNFDIYGNSKFVLRVDAFNLTNSVLFPSPDSTPTDANYGVVTRTQQNNPRVLQFALKLKF
jgi:hypothetical protein